MSILTCSAEDCERPRYGRMEICTMHYSRVKRNGTTEKVRKPQLCTVPDCGASRYGHGYCHKHYKRWKKYGTTELPKRTLRTAGGCEIPGCDKPYSGDGLCAAHYTRRARTGDPLTRKRGEVVDGKRICPACEIDKPLSEWGNYSGYCAPCSRERVKAYAKRNPRPRIVEGYKPCDNCGKEFPFNKKRSTHCSPECFEANKNRRNLKHIHKRRARMRKAFVEAFHSREIYERDGWVCQLCMLPIDPTLRAPSPMVASLDHIHPISRGGLHERANVQAAHMRCNSIKGVKMPA